MLVNARGERFLDEGGDFHSYTYAKYGHEVMKQPGLFAWQIFDSKIDHLLREEYRIARITKETANTLEELAPKLTGVDPQAVLATLHAYNAAPRPDVAFNPNIHDGLRTVWPADGQDQLGAEAGYAAISCLRRDGGRDVHFRRPEGVHRARRSRTPAARRSPACSPPGRSSVAFIIIITAAARDWWPG